MKNQTLDKYTVGYMVILVIFNSLNVLKMETSFEPHCGDLNINLILLYKIRFNQSVIIRFLYLNMQNQLCKVLILILCNNPLGTQKTVFLDFVEEQAQSINQLINQSINLVLQPSRPVCRGSWMPGGRSICTCSTEGLTSASWRAPTTLKDPITNRM